MLIEYDRGLFYATVPYQNRNILRQAGWQWNPKQRRWTTPDAHKVVDFEAYCRGKALVAVRAYQSGKGAAALASKAGDADIHVPAPEGCEYLPFQKAGIAYGLMKDNVLIADPPGLGKTIQAIGIVNALDDSFFEDPEFPEIMIICRAELMEHWRREFDKWDVRGLKIGIVETISTDVLDSEGNPMRTPSGGKKKKQVDVWPDEECNVIIGGPSLLQRHDDTVKERPWDVLIVDEAEMFANPQSQRGKFFWGGGRGRERKYAIKAKKRICLTGTPIQTKPLDIWVFCKNFDPKGIGASWFDFVYRYCDAYEERFGNKSHLNTTGISNLPELNIRLREAFMVRRNKEEVLGELPPKRREIIILPDDGITTRVKKEMNEISDLLAQFEADVGIDRPDTMLDAFADNLPEINGDMSFEEMADQLTPELAVTFDQIATYRKQLALAKAPMVKTHVDKLLESEEKLVLFCYHKDVANYFKQFYDNQAVFITGDVAPKKRQGLVDLFQNDNDVRLTIGTMGAAGVGYTMTAARMMVMAELDWVASVMQQAEDRIWRIGQENACLIQYPVVNRSLDAYMVETVIERIKMIDAALNA